MASSPFSKSVLRVYLTAFIGLFFDYYDLYLFIYLEKAIAGDFGLSDRESAWVQGVGLAGVGVGSLCLGYLADKLGRGRVMLGVLYLYICSLIGLSLAQNVFMLILFRFLASMALGGEWGIGHAYLAERVAPEHRYRMSAWLQFSILGGLLAALAARYGLPLLGWRWLFGLSIIPVAILAWARGRLLTQDHAEPGSEPSQAIANLPLWSALKGQWSAFALGLGVASLTIASGTMNVFFAKELPQSVGATVIFWLNVAPGMLVGAWAVKRWSVKTTLLAYAIGVVSLSGFSWVSTQPAAQRALVFAVMMPLLNGIPFGLMGAWFNELFSRYRTMCSGAAYNLGRILAGFAPYLVVLLGLRERGNYFIFTALLGLGVLTLVLVGSRLSEPSRQPNSEGLHLK